MASAVIRSTPPALAYAGLTVTTACWAVAFVAGKVVLAEMTPLPVAAFRYAAAAAVLLPFAVRAGAPREFRSAAGPLALMVLAGGVVYPWLFLLALSRTSATNTALLIALNPILTVLLSPLVGERLDGARVGGVALALVGAGTVIAAGGTAAVAATGSGTGDLMAVAAAATWATFNLASRRVVRHLAPAFTNCAVYGVGGLALYLLGRAEGPWTQLAQATPAALGGLLVMGLLSSAVAGQLFLVGVRTVGVARTVVFVYLVPVLTALLSVAVLGEVLTAAQALGGTAVLAGIWWTTRSGGSG
jgi:drug/metabolite transporter (DMT)-like permease